MQQKSGRRCGRQIVTVIIVVIAGSRCRWCNWHIIICDGGDTCGTDVNLDLAADGRIGQSLAPPVLSAAARRSQGGGEVAVDHVDDQATSTERRPRTSAVDGQVEPLAGPGVNLKRPETIRYRR